MNMENKPYTTSTQEKSPKEKIDQFVQAVREYNTASLHENHNTIQYAVLIPETSADKLAIVPDSSATYLDTHTLGSHDICDAVKALYEKVDDLINTHGLPVRACIEDTAVDMEPGERFIKITAK